MLLTATAGQSTVGILQKYGNEMRALQMIFSDIAEHLKSSIRFRLLKKAESLKKATVGIHNFHLVSKSGSVAMQQQTNTSSASSLSEMHSWEAISPKASIMHSLI